MNRVIAVVSVGICIAGCSHSDAGGRRETARPATLVCPSDDDLRDAAIAASRTTYRNAPGGTRKCACPEDTYERAGEQRSCSGPGAVRPATWVMCRRDQVPGTLVAEMRAKLPGCKPGMRRGRAQR